MRPRQCRQARGGRDNQVQLLQPPDQRIRGEGVKRINQVSAAN